MIEVYILTKIPEFDKKTIESISTETKHKL